MANQKIRESALRRFDDAQLGDVLGTSDWGRALAVLWDRHAGLFYSTARSLCRNDDDARDAMSDALAKIAQRAADGTLSVESSFKSYAVMVVRNACHDAWRRTGRVDVTDEVDVGGGSGGSFLPDPVVDDVDEKFVAMAFSRLPERYRQVLWLTEVEGLPPREVADLLSMTPNNVSQVAVRARMALREGWAAEHLSHVDSSSPCHGFAKLLPAFAAGSLATERVSVLQNHLAQCADCAGLHTNLMADTVKLRGLALPIPVILTFRYLRGLAGGAAQGAGQGAGFFSQAFEAVRRSVGVVQALATTGQNAVLVGVGAVAAVATVGVGTFALTNIVGDSPRNGDAAVELGESNDPDSNEEASPPADQPVASAPEVTAPAETTPPPPETSPPTNPPTPAQTQPPSDIDFSDLGGWGGFGNGIPNGDLQNDTIITLGSPIPLGSSRSWTYWGVAGTTILVSSSAGSLSVSGPGAQVAELDAANGSMDSPSYPGDWLLLPITETTNYTIVLRATVEEIKSSAQILVSVDNTEILPNVLTPLDTELPFGLGRIWKFNGTAGEPIAVGVERVVFKLAILLSPSGMTQYCESMCIPNESGIHAIAVINNGFGQLPNTQSFAGRVGIESGQTETQAWYDPWPGGAGVQVSTPSFDVAVDSPYELSSPVASGLKRIGRFTANVGDVRACFASEELWCRLFGTNSYPIHIQDVQDSGTNWILVESFAPAPMSASQYVEVASPSGPTTLNTLNSIPFGHIGAFWSIDGSAGDVYSVYSETHPTWFRSVLGNSGAVYGFGGGSGLGWSRSVNVIPTDGTYFVGIEGGLVYAPPLVQQVVVSSDSIELLIDEPKTFAGSIHEWRQSLWRFQADAGQVLYSSESIFVFRIVEGTDGSYQADGTSCPCAISEPGTYYMIPDTYSLPTPSTVQIGTVRQIAVNEPFTLPSSVGAYTRLNFSFSVTQPGSFGFESSDNSWESVRGFGLLDGYWYECQTYPCYLPESGEYLFSIKAGASGFPAGMQIKIFEATSGP